LIYNNYNFQNDFKGALVRGAIADFVAAQEVRHVCGAIVFGATQQNIFNNPLTSIGTAI
jgi:hypothetical protein